MPLRLDPPQLTVERVAREQTAEGDTRRRRGRRQRKTHACVRQETGKYAVRGRHAGAEASRPKPIKQETMHQIGRTKGSPLGKVPEIENGRMKESSVTADRSSSSVGRTPVIGPFTPPFTTTLVTAPWRQLIPNQVQGSDDPSQDETSRLIDPALEGVGGRQRVEGGSGTRFKNRRLAGTHHYSATTTTPLAVSARPAHARAKRAGGGSPAVPTP